MYVACFLIFISFEVLASTIFVISCWEGLTMNQISVRFYGSCQYSVINYSLSPFAGSPSPFLNVSHTIPKAKSPFRPNIEKKGGGKVKFDNLPN